MLTIVIDNSLDVFEQLTVASLRLHEYMLFDNGLTAIDLIKTPVLVLFDNTTVFESGLINDTDSIVVNTLDCTQPLTYIYGAIVPVMKLLKSANKLKDIFRDTNNNIKKFPFTGPLHEHFQLIWYAQRIGLKIYEQKK